MHRIAALAHHLVTAAPAASGDDGPAVAGDKFSAHPGVAHYTDPRSGARALIKTLVANDCSVCFTNPGTSEMHFVAGLDAEPAMRPILVLQVRSLQSCRGGDLQTIGIYNP